LYDELAAGRVAQRVDICVHVCRHIPRSKRAGYTPAPHGSTHQSHDESNSFGQLEDGLTVTHNG
jgi:hypothetical protein